MLKRIKNRFFSNTHDFLFKLVHSRWLIYNSSWEDPRIDRQLLELNPDSKVVMLTSAGCNTLDYALDSPAEIHAIDVNPRQNALLHLKLALIKRGDFADLFKMFGEGSHERFEEVYRDIRSSLPAESVRFWDEKIRYFSNTNKKRSFYYYGTSGLFAWLITRYLNRNPQLRGELLNLIAAKSLEEQEAIYARIEPLLWGRFVSWVVKQPATLAMLGVPRPQIRLIDTQYPGGMVGYVSDKLRQVFTKVFMHENYFWRVYLTGTYTANCCPNYLKAENFRRLQNNIGRVFVHTQTISEFLQQNPGTYSHFVLLDHQDWLAQHNPQALQEEWELILKNSRPGSKILMRSAATRVDFLPELARDSLRFYPELTERLHSTDRVGTYGSLHFAEIT